MIEPIDHVKNQETCDQDKDAGFLMKILMIIIFWTMFDSNMDEVYLVVSKYFLLAFYLNYKWRIWKWVQKVEQGS